MTDNPLPRKIPLGDLAPDWLRLLGVIGWLAIGVTGALVVVAWFFGAIASIAIPLAFAIMLGVVFSPLVDVLQRAHVPRVAGAVIALLVVIFIVGGAVWITVSSVVSQGSVIMQQVQSAWDQLGLLAASAKVPPDILTGINTAVRSALPTVAQAVAALVTKGLGSTISLLFGVFLSMYMLYLVLADYRKLGEWVGGHLGLPVSVGSGIVEDTASSLRAYFRGSTIIGIANAVVIALGMWALGVPLIFPVAIVTVVLGYIPFFGALVSGMFAVVIALGANGFQTSMILLVIVLFSQNVVQMPISSWVMGDALELHPIVVLIATMIGAIFGGLIGGMLGAPMTAVVVRTVSRIREASQPVEDGPAG